MTEWDKAVDDLLLKLHVGSVERGDDGRVHLNPPMPRLVHGDRSLIAGNHYVVLLGKDVVRLRAAAVASDDWLFQGANQ